MDYITSEDFQLRDSAVALGKFEGIHRGHQLLLNEIKKQKKNNYRSVVFTFDMPPRRTLQGDTSYQQLFIKEERRAFLEEMGMDVLIEYPFTREFASLSPDEFVRKILVGQAGAKVVVVGTDFRFGRKRSGGIEDLSRLSKELGYQLIVKEKVQDHHMDISSSRIRSLIEAGKMEEASGLLGRPHSITGPVIHGKALGRTINIPTANQKVDEGKLVPPNGVYVARVKIGEETFGGITNIGVRPTVENDSAKGAETYIFDFDKDIYGRSIEVDLLHFCRPEMKFASLVQLKEQMMRDIAFGKEFLDKSDWKGAQE